MPHRTRHRESIADPVEAALRDAPLDDEPETEQEKRAVAIAREQVKKAGGKGVPHAEGMKRLGLD